MELTDIAVIRRLCAAHGFSLSKGLGQNFIVNPGVCPKIVEASGIDGTYGVLEIGPGIGVLTKELALRARRVPACPPCWPRRWRAFPTSASCRATL